MMANSIYFETSNLNGTVVKNSNVLQVLKAYLFFVSQNPKSYHRF